MTHLCDGRHHQLEELRLRIPARIFEQARPGAARVVDQVVDRETLTCAEVEQVGRRVGQAQICSEGVDRHAMILFEFGREGFEDIFAAGHEDEVVSLRAKLARELETETGDAKTMELNSQKANMEASADMLLVKGAWCRQKKAQGTDKP